VTPVQNEQTDWLAPSGQPSEGGSSLVYRKTLLADAPSIDTGVDAADAGSKDWTNGDLLEVYMLIRTDTAVGTENVDVTLNNDTGNNYDRVMVRDINATVLGSTLSAQAKWFISVHGSGGSASYATECCMVFPGYAGATFFKTGFCQIGTLDAAAANNEAWLHQIGYRSTAPITRLKVAAEATAKLKAGSMLLIYKRVS
jgi:hypothetical protein